MAGPTSAIAGTKVEDPQRGTFHFCRQLMPILHGRPVRPGLADLIRAHLMKIRCSARFSAYDHIFL
jgi:hypothetical protein